ncbi:MAG: hypothetical protein GQ559_05980 [Desulfobulbaceae bacterium]|nr:hypothetical protein [Desulfobulbaceae bacterium]
MSPGHLTEFREMLPSTSDGMKSIRVFLNLSQCYDVFDVDGDGTEEAMGVQYYIAFQGCRYVGRTLVRKSFVDQPFVGLKSDPQRCQASLFFLSLTAMRERGQVCDRCKK